MMDGVEEQATAYLDMLEHRARSGIEYIDGRIDHARSGGFGVSDAALHLLRLDASRLSRDLDVIQHLRDAVSFYKRNTAG